MSDDSSSQPAGVGPALSALDVFAFVIELAGAVILAFWGFVFWPFPWNIVFGLGAPALAIVVWGLFVSPRAVFAVHPFVRGFIELVVYLSVTVALWSMELAWVGIGYGVLAVVIGVFVGRRRLG